MHAPTATAAAPSARLAALALGGVAAVGLATWVVRRAWAAPPKASPQPPSPTKEEGRALNAPRKTGAKGDPKQAAGGDVVVRRTTSVGSAPLTARIRAVRPGGGGGGSGAGEAASPSDARAAADFATPPALQQAPTTAATTTALDVLPPPASLPPIRTTRPPASSVGGGADSLPTTPKRAGPAESAAEASPFAWDFATGEEEDAASASSNKTSPTFLEVVAMTVGVVEGSGVSGGLAAASPAKRRRARGALRTRPPVIGGYLMSGRVHPVRVMHAARSSSRAAKPNGRPRAAAPPAATSVSAQPTPSSGGRRWVAAVDASPAAPAVVAWVADALYRPGDVLHVVHVATAGDGTVGKAGASAPPPPPPSQPWPFVVPDGGAFLGGSVFGELPAVDAAEAAAGRGVPPPPPPPPPSPPPPPTTTTLAAAGAVAAAAASNALAGRPGITAALDVVLDSPAGVVDGIVRGATALGADALVVGPHAAGAAGGRGRGGGPLSGLLGASAASAAALAPSGVPVIVLPAIDGGAPPPRTPVRRVLVCAEGTDGGRAAAAGAAAAWAATALLPPTGGEVVVFHCVRRPPPGGGGGFGPDGISLTAALLSEEEEEAGADEAAAVAAACPAVSFGDAFARGCDSPSVAAALAAAQASLAASLAGLGQTGQVPPGVTVRAAVRAGVSPGDAILAAAAGDLSLEEEEGGPPPSSAGGGLPFDALCLVHHPQGWLSRALTGSVASAVLARNACPVPVCVLHAPKEV